MKIIATLSIVIALAGCENMMKTMVAHYRLSDQQLEGFAKYNALINVCLSEKKMDPQLAYNFSTVAAQFLEMTVYSSAAYKAAYDNTINFLYPTRQHPDFAAFCEKTNNDLPRLTADANQRYAEIANSLRIARAEESQRIAQSMNTFGSQFKAQNFGQGFVPTFPKLQYSSEVPASQNYLVQTNSGISNCRVTRGNYVFCF